MSRALIPAAFVEALQDRAAARLGPPTSGLDTATWLRRLPGLIDAALERWDLRLDDGFGGGGGSPSRYGECALVVAVRRRDGTPAALKLTWPHPEARHEHLALRAWDGRGAVRLLAAYPADQALLLERLDAGRDLEDTPIEEACTRIGTLLAMLDRPALPQLDTLSAWTRRFVHESAQPDPRLPRRFIEQARSLAVDLLGDDLDSRLVHTDLHYANVLAVPESVVPESVVPESGHDVVPGPAAWRAIDPKPMAADPAFAVWPALHNRWAEAVDDDLAWHLRCRLGWVTDAAGLDEDRARAWALIRTVADARDLLAEPAAGDLLSQRIRLLKALQPDA